MAPTYSNGQEMVSVFFAIKIAASMDSGKAIALTLLDFSAAFDTLDHNILFNCLRGWFGVDGTVLR